MSESISKSEIEGIINDARDYLYYGRTMDPYVITEDCISAGDLTYAARQCRHLFVNHLTYGPNWLISSLHGSGPRSLIDPAINDSIATEFRDCETYINDISFSRDDPINWGKIQYIRNDIDKLVGVITWVNTHMDDGGSRVDGTGDGFVGGIGRCEKIAKDGTVIYNRIQDGFFLDSECDVKDRLFSINNKVINTDSFELFADFFVQCGEGESAFHRSVLRNVTGLFDLNYSNGTVTVKNGKIGSGYAETLVELCGYNTSSRGPGGGMMYYYVWPEIFIQMSFL